VGLLILAREGGGRIEVLLEMLPLALDGRAVAVLRMGFTGNRLGDRLLLSAGAGRATILLASLGSVADDRPYLFPASAAGVRRDRVLEGTVDMVWLRCCC
jgi:hypothetical protein